MTRDELLARYPQASRSFLERNARYYDPPDRVLPHPQCEPHPVDEPVATVPRETARQGRVRICVTSLRVRITDDDNLALGAKPLIDCIVAAGLIPSDSPVWCEIQHLQKWVGHQFEERTEIVIENL